MDQETDEELRSQPTKMLVLFKTLFKFVSQCSLVPCLESGLCNVGNELDNYDFAVVYPSNGSFCECNCKSYKYKTSLFLCAPIDSEIDQL